MFTPPLVQQVHKYCAQQINTLTRSPSMSTMFGPVKRQYCFRHELLLCLDVYMYGASDAACATAK